MSENERKHAKNPSRTPERPQTYEPYNPRERRREYDSSKPRERRRNHDPSKPRERRKKPDWVTRMATILSVVSWAAAAAVLLVLDRAKPEKQHLFTRMFGVDVRDYWNTAILPAAFTLLCVSLGICIIAFFFNMLRMKRHTDKFKKSIIIIAAINIAGIVFFILRFGAPW